MAVQLSGFLRKKQAAALVGVSQVTLWRWSKNGHFPKLVALSPGLSAYRAKDIQLWLAERGAA